MKLPAIVRDNPYVSIALAVAAVLFVVLVLIWFYVVVIWTPQHNAKIAAQNKAEAAVSRGEAAAAKDAVGEITRQAADETAIDATTRSNAHEIESAPGAHDTVSPELDRAARLSICRRQSASRTESCKRLLNAHP